MFKIRSLDHVGLRVTDREGAARFFAGLGFRPEPGEDAPEHSALGLINDAGVRLNLIYNASPPPGGANVLMDVADKWPGWTHAAFVVDDLDALLAWLRAENVRVTEGPVVYGDGRRRVCFIRDADGNVIEFNQILARQVPGQETAA
ncbi:VOC family protein [Arenibaculum sp.]|uniref:VOC family protein n=1 Tax=Arenibaculum sp. TaxID=2865862 RepID=UPI002E12F21B|nr:VOC family protein [Arenibaculum sp.]